jgi:phage FluMu gp28-like protein
MSVDVHTVDAARRLYADGYRIAEIAPRVGKAERTLRLWARKYGWRQHTSPEAQLEGQINALLAKDEQSEAELRKIDALSRSLAKLRKGQDGRRERVERERKADGDGNGSDPHSWAFAYQRRFLEDPAPVRMVKKARQIGWTLTISWEGLVDGLKRGRDKGYMSASFRQTQQINRYVKQIARTRFGLKLKGSEVIKLPNGAELHFFASNPATAQGFSGDMYFDEFAWLQRARECYENAGAITTLKDYRITICSTPSVHSHYFEELWDESRSGLEASRHQVTIIDAIEQGNNLVDLGKLLKRFSPQAIRRLFMCETLDDQGGAFGFDEVMACVRDEPELFERKPGERIWGGLDVSRMRDDTSAAFLRVEGGEHPRFTWRDLQRFSRLSLTAQEGALKGLLADWQPERFLIDATTIGEHMTDALSEDFEGVEGVRFTASAKAQMVTHLQNVVRTKRIVLPFDQRVIDSFLAIKLKALETMVGYEAEGNESIGHADDFWALALATYPAFLGGGEGGFILS